MTTHTYTNTIKILGTLGVAAAIMVSFMLTLPASAAASTGDNGSQNWSSNDWNNNTNTNDWQNNDWKDQNGITWWNDCSQTMWDNHKDWWGGMNWSDWSTWCMDMQKMHQGNNDWGWQLGVGVSLGLGRDNGTDEWNKDDRNDDWNKNNDWQDSNNDRDCNGDTNEWSGENSHDN